MSTPSSVYVVISKMGFIMGVFLSRERAEAALVGNPHLRISHEPVLG